MKFHRNTGFLVLSLLTAFFLSACGGGGGEAPPPPPTTTTVAATGISLHTATLNGTVNPHAQATTALFEWGTDNTLASPTLTAAQSVGAGSADNSVSASLTGLTLGTTYYYRVSATNASGTQKGAIASFTTALPNSPPSITTEAATSVTISSATLNGTISPNELATSAAFEWGTDSTLATSSTTTAQVLGAGTTSVAITAPLTDLTPGVKYYFRVTATNSAGTSKGTIANFTAVAQAPTVTTGAATSPTLTGGTLNGSVNPNGLAVSDYHFEYGTDSNLTSPAPTPTTGQTLAAGFSVQPITASLTDLTPGTKYYFRVVATNSVGTTKGSIVSFATVAQAPTVVTGAATSPTTSGGTLNGTVNPNGLAVTDAHFEYGTSSTLPTFITTGVQTLAAGLTAQSIAASQTGLDSGTKYYFRVVATNSAGTTNGPILSFDTVAPPPTVVTSAATSITTTGATLNGTVNPNGLATDGHFEWGTDPTLATNSTTSTQVMGSGGSAAAITAPLTGLPPGTKYYFRTVATNAGGTSKGTILSVTPFVFFDDFSTDTTGTYTDNQTFGAGSTFIWDNTGQRALVTNGGTNGIEFSHTTSPALTSGVFSIDFNPTAPFYGTHGGFWIQLIAGAGTYYEISNFDWGANSPTGTDNSAAVKKFVGGIEVDTQLFTTGYSQGATYNIMITFSPTQVTVDGFGAQVVLSATDTTPISVGSFKVETGQQNAYYDNILVEKAP